MAYIIVKDPLSKCVTCATLANSLRKQYYCEKCNCAFSKLYHLRLHMKSHTFRCALCSRRYFYKSLLRKHIHTEHTISKVREEGGNFKCEKCSKIFLTKQEYILHQWSDHLYKFPCINCRMAFKTKEEYDNHKRKMHPDKFHCLKSGCQKVFKTKEEYDYHINQPHQVIFQCSKNDCEMVFQTKEECDDHRKLSHIVKFQCSKIDSQMVLKKNLNDNQCLVSNGVQKKKRSHLDNYCCEKIFKTKEEYDNHKKEHKLKECKICGKRRTDMRLHMISHQPKSHVCNICNKYFRYHHDVRKHLLLHLKIKQFKCEYCGKSFTQKGSLTSHERMHTGIKPFKCKMCSSSFSRKDNLATHEKSVHGGKEARKFSCDKCKFSAVNQTKLNYHKNNYHQKIFQCDVCSAVLRCQKSLDRHAYTHSDEKPFPCYYCDRSYVTKANFRRHLKKVHS